MATALLASACGGVPAAADKAPPTTPSAPATAAAPAALAHWAFDEQRGNLATETLSGRADPVNFVFNRARFKPNSDPFWRSGPACIKGGCLLFDGYSTDIAAPGLTAAQTSKGFTVSAWVAPHAFEWGDGDQYSSFLSQFDRQSSKGFAFGVHRFGAWGIKMGFGASVADFRVKDRKLPKDAWSHVAASYDPAAGVVRLYLNGEQVSSAAAPAGGVFGLPAVPLTIGRHSQPLSTAGVFQFNTYLGLMDEVRVASGVAGAAAIAREFAADLASHGGKPPVLKPADVSIDASVFDGDRYRPQFHAMPDFGWMNEPHAPFFHKGQYHLFFQKNPFGPFWHQIHWGHWVSPDMVRWREVPMALAPDDDTLAPDGIWSGSANFTEDGTPALFFTAGNDSLRLRERSGMALASDVNDTDLVNWSKLPAPVTLQGEGEGRAGDFRDPFVFRDGANRRWFQLVGSVVPGRSGAAMVYESADLKNWTYRGPLFTIDPVKYPSFVRTFELPVLLPIGKGKDGRERHVFLADLAAQAYYWTGVFDTATARFIPDSEAPRVFDLGEGHFSGPSGFVDPRTGRTIVFSIAQGERTAQTEWESGWAHNAGLPIELRIGPDGDLRLAPIQELGGLREAQLLDLRDATPAVAAARLARVGGDLLEVELELAPSKASKARRGLVLRKTPDNAERTGLYVDPASQRFEIDRTRTTLDPDMRSHGVQGGAFDLAGENLRLRVFLDRSMVEAYVNERKSLTSRVFPARLDATGLDLLAAPDDRIVSLKVWRMGASNGKPVAPAQPSGVRFDPATAFTTGLPNGDFANCDLSGWNIVEGGAFANRGVTQAVNVSTYQYNAAFRMPDRCHFAGAGVPGGDAATGVMRSARFVLGGDGRINFLLAGGRDPERLHVALVRAADGKELMRAGAIGFEQYQRVFWDASAFIGEELYLQAVDRATGEGGHLNLDSVNVPVARLVK
ncbi:Sucrose-6-phosphate hydrolase SacC, GH32 family [Pseudoduganella namucuonensis]|uniref:beta-fructofuranosidase n=2 Tax=Pseudoduganella namucuonensis TaxID=1035707 RepID=A0A1I7EUX0_9BURK|nr:Sucrose-6-phosphate hydrolase SacC, GH32 family [Pseudoduganella namucuonensis]